MEHKNFIIFNFITTFKALKYFQPGGSSGDLENGGDVEESDIEYDEPAEGNGGRRAARARHSRRRGLSNRSGASHPDQYRYDFH